MPLQAALFRPLYNGMHSALGAAFGRPRIFRHRYPGPMAAAASGRRFDYVAVPATQAGKAAEPDADAATASMLRQVA